MQRIRQFIFREHTLVFLFCMAAITGPAISVLFANDLSQFPDANTYLGLAEFNFDQSPVRRFRVLVPFTAALLNFLFGGLFARLAPTYFTGDFGLPFSFFVINLLLMSYFGQLIYRYCRAYGLNAAFALGGVMVMLTGRYTHYLAGLPLVDSLFCVTVAWSLLGIKQKNTSMLLWAIFLGPFAKEAFIFIAPLIFFFSHISKKKLALYFILSGILVFGYRYIYELYEPSAVMSGLKADFYHVYLIPKFLPVLVSFYGVYKILSNLFLWALIPMLALIFIPGYVFKLWNNSGPVIKWFLVAVLLQMMLSVSVERMFYTAMPVLCLGFAMSANLLKKEYSEPEK